MTCREFLEQLAEQGRVNEIIDKCLDLQNDICSLEQDKENLLETIEILDAEKTKVNCSLYVEQQENEKLRSRCNECSYKTVALDYNKMTDYERLISFLKKAGIEYDTDTYTYRSEKGENGILKYLVQFGKLVFEWEYEGEIIPVVHNFICQFDGNGNFVKMYNKEED